MGVGIMSRYKLVEPCGGSELVEEFEAPSDLVAAERVKNALRSGVFELWRGNLLIAQRRSDTVRSISRH
jgi:hypothetical protein